MFQKIANNIDEYGRLKMDTEDIINLYVQQGVEKNIHITDNDEYEKYIKYNKKFNRNYDSLKKLEPINIDSNTYLQEYSKEWIIPEKYYDYDIIEILKSRCNNTTELDRMIKELNEFVKRDQIQILYLMFYLVDWLKENNIVWGVGRGSSVASFVLYLIGINRINPLEFDIDMYEFFK